MKKDMKKNIVLALLAVVSMGMYAQEKLPAYKNTELSFEERTWDLIHRMTLSEKAAQMVNGADALPELDVPNYNWWNECLHGLARAGRATVFPQAIGLAATFDSELIYEIADATSDEGRAFYNSAVARGNRRIYTGLTYYSPNVNIFRDPRWGRGQETYGEDPYLSGKMGTAFVKGIQGNDPKYLKAAACAKHYAVHSGPEEFRHEFDAVASTRDLYETYFPAFKALVQEGNVKSVMGAYNRVNGEAACASKWLLTDILRTDWGFKGYVTSDCGALIDVFAQHKLVKNDVEAAALAANSGLNLNCGNVYRKGLVKAVEQNLLAESTIDTLLYELMITRFELGLFDNPEDVPFNKVDEDIVDSKRHEDLAYKAALNSVVLLENKNNVLPLSGKENYIYVTGPNANNPDALVGNYYGVSSRFTTFAEGVAHAAAKGVTVEYRQGVMINQPNVNPIDWASGEAGGADATVACVGLTSLLEGEEGESIASAQRGDMMNNALPKAQIDYLKKLKNNQKRNQPLIVVITGGCPVDLTEIKEIADAILFAWYPGEAGGKAVADIIFGNESPSGRSPLTFVKDVNKLPAFTDYSMTGRTYRYMTDTANILYPFGYGLSYAKFEYSKLVLPKTIKAGQAVNVSVEIKNAGSIKAEEVVQVYVSDQKASVEVPIRRLAGFTRVSLAPGETKTVSLEVAPEAFSLITDKDQRMVEAGMFDVSVGGGQPIASTVSYIQQEVKVKGKKQLEL